VNLPAAPVSAAILGRSYDQMTGAQLSAAQAELELAAATRLGQMLFEFARLDTSLGLCLVWSGEGRQVGVLTKQVADYSFHKKLVLLKDLVDEAFEHGSREHSAYIEWLDDAHAMRTKRNQLVHGRWGTDPRRNQVFNVIGLPTSLDQREVYYSIEDLQEQLEQLTRLLTRLNELRFKLAV
jgi:hypothetical protein